jgi:hypothetical protein
MVKCHFPSDPKDIGYLEKGAEYCQYYHREGLIASQGWQLEKRQKILNLRSHFSNF